MNSFMSLTTKQSPRGPQETTGAKVGSSSILRGVSVWDGNEEFEEVCEDGRRRSRFWAGALGAWEMGVLVLILGVRYANAYQKSNAVGQFLDIELFTSITSPCTRCHDWNAFAYCVISF